jgi:surface protein
MYEIFVNNHKSSYCFYDDEINAQKHPQIELGSTIFIPDLGTNYLVVSPQKWQLVGDLVGIDLRTALTYLNADTSGEKITTNINTITYGFNKDHMGIVNNYSCVPVDVEQDNAVNIYYVLNNDKYDIYVLADKTIYAPKDSSSLYEGMSALKSVDTSNYSVNRVVNMNRLFRDCAALELLDVSKWNTSNVTNMRDLFRGCKSLSALDVSKWNTGKVETTIAMF